MRGLLRVIFATFFIAGLSASASMGSDLETKDTSFNFQAGLFSPGAFWVDDYEADTDMSFGLSGGLDYKLGEKISGGAVLAMNNFSGYDDSAIMVEIGFLIKAWIGMKDSNLLFRPGFGLSYGKLGKVGPADASDYLVINGLIELVIQTESNLNWLVTIGITGAPAGGNNDYDMTYGPGFVLKGGLVF